MIPLGFIVSGSPRSFTISPSVNGRSTWNLNSDGPMTITSAGTYTFTPLSSFACTVEMWGPGGNSANINSFSFGNSPATTFDGMSAGGGKSSTGATGATGGTATGGDINNNGASGGNGQNNTITNVVGGVGGSCPSGGSGGAQTVDSTLSSAVSGNSGAAPGGGGSGPCNFAGNGAGQVAIGGGGSGARLLKSILAGHFTANAALTIVVGSPPAVDPVGTNGRSGTGAVGQFKIT